MFLGILQDGWFLLYRGQALIRTHPLEEMVKASNGKSLPEGMVTGRRFLTAIIRKAFPEAKWGCSSFEKTRNGSGQFACFLPASSPG
ncbi:hypothetical protein CEXT_498511 [Caerostris extrusa]|uniref:Uncharacterized protein n=1 Tax=Caerostris extrusa TaxID=172846 RepID=A0AAV4TK64_CAEEX|nr:hypothetical protein CEXT_498511 [Caerostris extrusa]